MLDGFFHWVQYGPPVPVWMLIVVLLGVSIICSILSYQLFYRRRLIEDLPTSKIQSAAQGYLELEGTAKLMDGPPIIAPLSGLQCVWYQYRIEEKKPQGKNQNWSVIKTGSSDDLFYLVDGTGDCVVDPENAKVTPSIKKTWYGNTISPGTTQGDKLPTGSFFSRGNFSSRYRYTEQRIHHNDHLHVIGAFRSVGGAGEHLDINEDVKELLIEWKRDSNRLLNQFDENKDGIIDIEEWQKVREAAYQEILIRHRDEKITLPTHMIEQTKDRRRPFILSAKPQSDYIQQLKLEFLLNTGIGFLLLIIASYLMKLRITVPI